MWTNELVSKLCQLLSGVFFGVLAGTLLHLNSNTLAATKRLPVDGRLRAAVKMSTYVVLFSAFFNLFQLTEVDDMLLMRSNIYTLDIARPVEWIVTCPMMQAVIVIIAGDRVPDYRLYLMPLLAALVLCTGLLAASLDGAELRLCVFCGSALVCGVMFFINRVQIVEVTRGKEGLMSGSSWMRKLSVILILTWVPFPLWFFISPEGADIVHHPAVVNAGYALLNMAAKGTFAIYVQVYKTKFLQELRHNFEAFSNTHIPKLLKAEYLTTNTFEGIDLMEVISETLDFLGMGARTPKFKESLVRASIASCHDFYGLTEETCKDARMPWELVFAVKQRLVLRTQEANAACLHIRIAEEARGEIPTEGMTAIQRVLAKGLCGDVEAVQRLIAEAEAARLPEPCLEVCRARLAEAGRWRTLRTFLATSGAFRAALLGRDAEEAEAAAKAAEAAGLDGQASEGRAHLEDLARRQAACKGAVKRGLESFRGGKFQEAVKAFSEALQQDPRCGTALLNRSAAHARLANWAESEEDAARCLELEPHNAKAHRKQVAALLGAGKPREAAAAAVRGLAACPESEELAQLRDKAVSIPDGGLAADGDGDGGRVEVAEAATQTEPAGSLRVPL